MSANILKNKIKTAVFLCKNTKNYSRQGIKKFLRMVPSEEKEKFFKFKNQKAGELYLLGKVMTRKIIAAILTVSPEELVFKQNKFGRPYLQYPKIKNFDFNLAHSGNYVILAISSKPIGVDIEKIRPIDIQLLTAQLHKKEQEEINACTNINKKTEKFFSIWTLKEAYMKALGRGLSLPIKNFYFRHKGVKASLEKQKNKNLWHFKTYRLDNYYFLSVCSCYEKSPQLTIFSS